jgi:hypothetical protein
MGKGGRNQLCENQIAVRRISLGRRFRPRDRRGKTQQKTDASQTIHQRSVSGEAARSTSMESLNIPFAIGHRFVYFPRVVFVREAMTTTM